MPDFAGAATAAIDPASPMPPVVPVIGTDQDAERMLERLAAVRAELVRVDRLHDDALARLTDRHEALAEPARREIARLEASLGAYAAMTYPDRKTVAFMGGTVKHRKAADRIEVADREAFMNWADGNGAHLVRVTYAPDRPAIHRHIKDMGEQPPGVVLVEGETRTHIETSEVTA